MRIFEDRTLGVGYIGLLKVAVLLVGLALGAWFAPALLPYAKWLLAAGVALGLYLSYVWFR